VLAAVAVEAFPVNAPVIPDVTVREFNAAFEPDVMTFFQFGILYRLYDVMVRYKHLCRVCAYFLAANNINYFLINMPLVIMYEVIQLN
jgi:hypothetical protein